MGKNAPVTVVKRVAVTMLGGFRIRVDGNVLTDEINRSQKLWNVLCYLIAHRERTVPQSEFIELFWPEENSANPTNALKTLLYRVRSLLEPLFGEGLEPILSQRGAYAWNPAIACEMDVDRFELLCRRAQDTALPAQKRMALYEEAAEVYRGDYLPKLANQMWVVPISAHYHTLYLEAVKEYADLLEHAEKFEAMAELCTRASQLDPLDESLHTLIVRALLRQGKDSAALSHYEKATDLLYRNLGVLNTTMDQLLEVLVHNLRRGDVVSKYSGAQYVVMLPAANFEDSTMVVERIVNAFYRQHRRNFLKITYRIRELS